MDPNDLNPKIKQLQVRAPQKNVFPKAQPNLKIEIVKIKPQFLNAWSHHPRRGGQATTKVKE